MRFLVALCVASSLSAVNLGLARTGENQPHPGAAKMQTSVGSVWQVGYAQADITPRPGRALMAGFGEERYADGALAPLRAQALVIQDGAGRRALLCAVDVLGFGPDTVELVRHRLQAAHGLAPADICLAASHTHWGPAINYRFNFIAGTPNSWYLVFLENTLVRLAGEAIRDLAPAEISYGACEAQIGMCRRLPPDNNGKVKWGPNPAGSYDRHTPILRIVRHKSPKQLIVVGHACHPTSSGSLAKWWPEYPGVMRERLETEMADCRAMFVMGCGGDAKVVAKDPKTGRTVFANSVDECRAAGQKLAGSVLRRLGEEKLMPVQGALHTKIVRGSLSLQPPRTHAEIADLAVRGNPRSTTTWWARQNLLFPDNRRTLDYEVQAWRVGPLTLVALQGEVCADWGAMTRAIAPADPVMVVAYANYCPTYIPTARITREGGYEGDHAHIVYFLPAPFEPRMESELTGLIVQALGRDTRTERLPAFPSAVGAADFAE